MGGYPDRIEFGAALTANEGGDDWHLAFHSEGSVMDTRRPQDLSALWERCGAWVRHVQVAGPDRHEPGPGEVAFLRHIGNLGYTGWISGEYVPAGRTEDGLDWLTQLRA